MVYNEKMRILVAFCILFFVAVATARNLLVPEGRITNGWIAKRAEAPYIVSLQFTTPRIYPHFCGGTILDKHWILTAAHCLMDKDISTITIKAGRYIFKEVELSEQERSIDYYKLHKLYPGGAKPNDIALIYVAEPFVWTNEVQPIALPKKDSTPTGEAQLFGWGLLSNENEIVLPEVLHTAKMPIISNAECNSKFNGNSEWVKEVNLCTGATNLGITVCNSDSGGPLVQKDSSNENVVIGVVSWGSAICGIPDGASVYTKVSAFVDWIKTVQNDYSPAH